MANKDPRIDAYIAQAADFAKPVLIHFRELVHKACPNVEEKMKWSFPHFDYKGEMMCSMASFNQHCAIGFWKAKLMKDADKLTDAGDEAMGHMGRITSLKDLPPDKTLLSYIREAVMLNEEGIKLPSKAKPVEKKEMEVPDDLKKALAADKGAKAIFEAFNYSNKKEYTEWITEAKTEKTRNERLATSLSWIAEGKTRHWKYKK